METFQYLNEYYSNYQEDARLLSRAGQVEYLTTMRYIERYLRPGMRVLEVGAGTGRYSVALAQRGIEVTAVELLPHNLEILKSKITPAMKLTALQGNALDLSFLPRAAFDMTLVLGPMYHLYSEPDKRAALEQALSVTRTGGVIMVAYCIAEGTMIDYVFKGNHVKMVLEEKMMNPETFELYSEPKDLFELVRREDIDRLTYGLPVKRLHYLATDGAAGFMRETLEAMDEEDFRTFLRYHLAMCERPDLVGATHHCLDVLQKTK